MLGFKCFIFSLFLLLSFDSSQYINNNTSLFESEAEITSFTDGTNHQAYVVDPLLESNQGYYSFKTYKIPFVCCKHKASQFTEKTYDYKLLYIKIGDGLPIQLTSRTLIFPFHFFT
ncbi:hypothetical protein NA63_2438 [Flavobacteriaceae bacterium MAR_2010_105]|nr:hypothetical protein NA63_2438 [Flavobacteriaceae bacterium MAR_2010_105]